MEFTMAAKPATQIDLNLFRVFELVMQHRNLALPARELGVIPSAVSHALNRLRDALGDELFSRVGKNMEPTPFALELAPTIHDGLSRLATAVTSAPFTPGRTARTFHIAASDYATIIVLAPLVERVTVAAPRVNLRLFPANRMDVIRYLDETRVDLALGWFGDLPERMHRATVVVEREAILFRAGHPLTLHAVTGDSLLAFPRIVVELTGSEEQADGGFLIDRGASRRVWIDRLLVSTAEHSEGAVGQVAVSVPYFTAVPPMLAITDMVAFLPLSIALRFAKHGECVVLEPPHTAAEVPLELVWHERVDLDAGVRWLKQELLDASSAGTTK
jgi:DNA-binding transcriptional LysR family regulator